MAALPEGSSGGVVDEEVWKKVQSVAFTSQASFFCNIKWTSLTDADKALISALLGKFDEQQKKFGAKAHQVSYPQFCKVLQELEPDHARVDEVLKSHGDRSSMGKRFTELGFKLRGDMTMIEGLLFLFNVTTLEVTTSPPTPCDAALRMRKAEMVTLEAKMADLVAGKEDCERREKEAQDAHKPMDATKARSEKTTWEGKIKDYEISYRKEVKAATKAISDAEAALAKEKSEGTAADLWLRAQCEALHISYAGW